MHILTAREFIDQGTSAGAIMSIAASQTTAASKQAVEAVAREVAKLTGATLTIPGAATAAREESRRRPANDNRPRRERRVAA
jgi:hypothetical protein